jgi:hypothetical protein
MGVEKTNYGKLKRNNQKDIQIVKDSGSEKPWKSIISWSSMIMLRPSMC